MASILGELINEFEANNLMFQLLIQEQVHAGVEDTINAVNDLGVASRALKDEEIEKGLSLKFLLGMV